MNAIARYPARVADAGLEIDWRWGFEPEAWMDLRSKKAMAFRPAAAGRASAEPSAPTRRFFPCIADAARTFLGG